MLQDNTAKWKLRKLTDFNVAKSALPIGHIYQSLNPNVPLGSLPLFGGLYDRNLYQDLWTWVQEQPDFLVSESEWQSLASANGGNVPKFSTGDGTNTFRVPSMKCWVKGANGITEVGSYLEAGLPDISHTHTRGTMNITGSLTGKDYAIFGAADITASGALSSSGDRHTSAGTSEGANYDSVLTLDASKSWTGETSTNSEVDSVYGNSDTVQPPSIVGMWLVVAFGTVTNIGNLDMTNVASGVENIQTRLNEHEHLLQENENALTIVGYHNSIYRGKYLGDKLTSAQSATIRAGEFEDLYIGDYWTIGGVNYRIAAFDYYYNCGDTACTTHHVVVVPDTYLYTAQMNTENVVTGGYVGSAMYTTNLNQAKTIIGNAFGTDHLLTIRQVFINAVTGSYATGGTWYDAVVWLMNEINVYGCPVFTNCSQGSNWAYNYTIDNTQYPLFALNPRMIHTRQTYWLRDVANSTAFALVGSGGYCDSSGSSNSYGVRPAFLVY